MNAEHWYFLIKGEYENKGAFVNFYAHGSHLGDALANVLECTKIVGLQNCQLIEANRLDLIDGFELPEKVERLSNDVQYQNSFSLFELNGEEFFISPTGIVKSTEDGEYDFELIKEHFVAYANDENGVFNLIMTISQANLSDVFYQCAEFLPDVTSIWIYLLGYWENEDKTELWINRYKNEKNEILDFIKTHEPDLIQNGFIDIVLNCQEGNTNLILDEHKQIRLTTLSEFIFNEFGKSLIDLGYEQTRDFYSLEYGYYHWHFRPAKSLDKGGFRKFLQRNKFEILEHIE